MENDYKEYIDKERMLLIVDDALFRVKSYDGGLNEETAVRILNNLKLLIKTAKCIKVNDKGEIING